MIRVSTKKSRKKQDLAGNSNLSNFFKSLLLKYQISNASKL